MIFSIIVLSERIANACVVRCEYKAVQSVIFLSRYVIMKFAHEGYQQMNIQIVGEILGNEESLLLPQ